MWLISHMENPKAVRVLLSLLYFLIVYLDSTFLDLVYMLLPSLWVNLYISPLSFQYNIVSWKEVKLCLIFTTYLQTATESGIWTFWDSLLSVSKDNHTHFTVLSWGITQGNLCARPGTQKMLVSFLGLQLAASYLLNRLSYLHLNLQLSLQQG